MTMPVDVAPASASVAETPAPSYDEIEAQGADPFRLINERRMAAEDPDALRLARSL